MKKFLVFLVAIVVAVSLGLTTYYFVRNDEVISIETKEIFCNTGDIISIDSLGISRKKPHHSTEFDYNAGGEEVSSMISYNAEAEAYIVNETAKGDITLVIGTNNKKFSKFVINVHVGNGSADAPYYVFGETQINKMGRVYSLDADTHYSLMNNVELTDGFVPIGSAEGVGFSGVLDGNGYTISGLRVTGEYANAGLFYTLNASAKVQDLVIESPVISGNYAYAGALAGEVYGIVDRVLVNNANITNNKENGVTGAITGLFSGIKMQSVAVEGGKITGNLTNNSVAGGFAGIIDDSDVKACYVNELTIEATNGKHIGGFAGVFKITNNTGSIQQSYANVTCAYNNFGAFIGKISEIGTGFDEPNADMLRHLIGNIVIISADSINDNNIVKEFNDQYFLLKNEDYVNRSIFYNTEAALYMVSAFSSVKNAVADNNYIYYAVDTSKITKWDTEFVWNVSESRLPTLTMLEAEAPSPSNEYFMRDMTITNTSDENFNNLFSTDIKDANIVFSDVKTYELNDYTPVNLSNSLIDGQGSTIRVNLANAKDGNLGLFATIDKSIVRNLNIVITGVNADATYAGGVAGQMLSTDSMAVSLIENVKVTFENAVTGRTITNFGGLVGTIHNGNIDRCEVVSFTADANSANIGGAVAVMNIGTISNTKVNANITGKEIVGGVVGDNKGTIQNATGTVVVKSADATFAGGIAGNNKFNIYNSEITLTMSIANGTKSINAGGVAGDSTGTIANVKVFGSGIALTGETNVSINIGGITANNTGSITGAFNLMNDIGTFHAGKNYNVAGIAVNNAGTISKVVAGSNIYGNIAAGLVCTMNTNGGNTIDQALVGKYDINTKAISDNVIKADKYAVGVAYNLSYGTISNVQTNSVIEGAANSARTSLIVLIFPSSGNLNCATINSALTGAGTKYRESWTDYAQVVLNQNSDTKYNIYDVAASAGVMKNVVMNTSREGVGGAKKAMGIVNRFAIFIPGGNTYNGNSFVKYVNNDEFYNSVSYTGSFTFNCAYDNFYDNYQTATATLDYNFDIWVKTNSGIKLAFIA